MGVTVMIRRRARSGQEDTFLRTALRGTASYANADTMLQHARVLQAVHDPSAFIWIAEWESREAYAARTGAVAAELDRLAMEPPERSWLHPVHSSEFMDRRITALTCVIVDAAADTIETARAMMQTRGRSLLEAHPGFAARHLYHDLERAHRLVAVLGWTSLAAAEQAVQIIDGHADELVDALGARRQSFLGKVAIEVRQGGEPEVWYPAGAQAG